MPDTPVDPDLSHAVVRYLTGPDGSPFPYRSWSRVRDVLPEYRGQAATIVRDLDYMMPDWSHLSKVEAVAQARKRFAVRYPQLDEAALDALAAVARWTWR